MITGLVIVLFGIVILFYPGILIILTSSILILFGVGMMVTNWQFRRLRKQSESRFINWIIRW